MAARNEVLAVAGRARPRRARPPAGRGRRPTSAEANLQRLLDLPAATRVEPAEPLGRRPRRRPDVEALVGRGAGRPRPSARRSPRASPRPTRSPASERGARLPQVALSGGYTYANPNRDIVPPTADWKDTWDVGVGVSLERLRRRPALGERGAGPRPGRRGARSSCASSTARSASRSRSARSSCAPPQARARASAERSVVSAAESRRVAGDRYREGVIPSSELLDAEIAHERAALARTEALAALRLAAAGLDRAVGALSADGAPPSRSASSAKRFGAFKAVDRVSLAVERGRDLRLPRARTAPASRRPSACSAACCAPTSGTGARPRHRRREGPRGREAAHRLHEPALQPLRRPHRRPEPALLRRRLRPARRGGPRARGVGARTWPGSRARRTASPASCPAAGSSGWPSPAPCCTSRASSSSTSPRAASTRSRAGASGA